MRRQVCSFRDVYRRLRRYGGMLTMVGMCWVIAGCSQVAPQADFARARQLITERTGVESVYDPDTPLSTDDLLEDILADGLSLNEALGVAVLNNRQLQAEFMSIGISKADWVQAGLLSNPTLGFSAQFPEGGGRSNIQTVIAQNIVDLWQIPRRRKIAQARLNQTVLRIAHVAAILVTDTKRAYFEAVAAEELQGLARRSLELVSESYEAVKAQRQAGAVSMLDENLARGQVLSSELSIRNARLAAANAKRRLAQLLSIGRNIDDIALSDGLPDQFGYLILPEKLIELARTSRLDLRALEHSVEARLMDIDVEKLRVFPDVGLGLAFERLEHRTTVDDEIDTILGPTLGLTLPIFDQNQAQIAKAKYSYRRELKAYQGACIRIAQDIRIATDVALTAFRSAAYYRDELVPQAKLNMEFARASYAAGQTGILILIEAQRLSVGAQRGYIAVRLDASTAMSDLERAVGMPAEKIGRVSDASVAPGGATQDGG